MWKEIVMGLLLVGAGVGLLWQQPANTKPPVSRVFQSNARLSIQVNPAASMQLLDAPASPSPPTTNYALQHVISSPGRAIRIRLSRPLFLDRVISWDGRSSRAVNIKLKANKKLPIVFLSVKSKPDGAAVYVGAQLFGMTPVMVVTKRDQALQLQVKKPKHLPLGVTWNGQRDEQRMIMLKRVAPDNMTLPPSWSWASADKVSVALAKATLAKGRKPEASDPRGNRMMHFAAFALDLKLAKWLLEQKADINARNLDGQTPLHIAFARAAANTSNRLHWAHMRFLGFMAEQGALPNALDRWAHTPLSSTLWLMAQQKASIGRIQTRVLQWLLQRGASIDAVDTEGKTPLHYAAMYGAMDVVKFLVKQKAVVNITDRSGRTPLDYTVRRSHFIVAAWLKQHGGKSGQ